MHEARLGQIITIFVTLLLLMSQGSQVADQTKKVIRMHQ